MARAYRTLVMLGSCLASATAITALFIAAATLVGAYTWLDIAIGSIWFFTISFIVSLLLLLPRLKRMLGC
ncbi:MAG: hypothetical protein NXY59_09630 [Aigarchaeota archaeon]|nr:hypothetical protein [Candidatus Pelearchaeum maunauluense]